ncbi:hypothetical protein ACSBR1_030510 [Camellia fascicularis]
MDKERVQAIASATKDTIPPEFIRPENEQPGSTTFHGRLPEVPVIDLSILDEGKLVELIDNASCKWGMFQVVNHGIPEDVISKLQKVGKEFFELPQEEKEMYAKPPGAKSVEGETNEEYARYLHGVVDKMLRTLSLGLGLEGDDMKKAVGGDELVYMMKINYYPPCPRPDLALGVVAHSDMSAVTILVPNDVQGLQIFQEDGYWYDVKYIPNALIIHIGDQVEILSNGKYKAVLHRSTVNKEKTRISWPVFLEPPPDFEVGPHPKLVNKDNPPHYKTKKFCDYVCCKLNKIPQ